MGELGNKYGLRRDNFILDPTGQDSDFYARRTGIKFENLVENLAIDLETGVAPKRLLFGPYGGGKTHTLHKTLRELERLTPIFPVVVECPDMDRRSRFLDLYKDGIMPSMGEKAVVELIEEAVAPIPGRGAEILGKVVPEFRGDEELAKAALRLRDPNFDPIDLWTWISGVSVSSTTLKNLSQRENLADATPARLAQVIITLASLMKKQRNSTMVLVLDEMDRLEYLGEEGAVTFRTAFTALTDPNQRHLSVLFGASAAQLRGLPDAFGGEAGPVLSRLGPNRIEIPALIDEDVDDFITDLTRYLRLEDFDLERACNDANNETSEEIVPEWFPFTRESVDAIKAGMKIITPREIMLTMTRALGRAYRSSKALVTTAEAAP
jgi:hypothetical protein